MRVKLTKDIKEKGNDGAERLKISKHDNPNRPEVRFVKDAVIEMSETTGKKYIEAGKGVEVK
jgi:hypothetical protein